MRIPVLSILAAAALAVGCGAPGPYSMVPIQPPYDWEDSLAQQRTVKDEFFRDSPDTPLLAQGVDSFAGLDYWPADERYYFAGPIHVHPEMRRFDIVTTAGDSRPCERYGWIDFPVDGAAQRLHVYRLLDSNAAGVNSLFLTFTDGTTGEETYPAGRYVDLEGPSGEIHVTQMSNGGQVAVGPFVLDFNHAFNPSCAYGSPERFACPVTPVENRLDARILAGERGYKLPPGTTG